MINCAKTSIRNGPRSKSKGASKKLVISRVTLEIISRADRVEDKFKDCLQYSGINADMMVRTQPAKKIIIKNKTNEDYEESGSTPDSNFYHMLLFYQLQKDYAITFI